jgi:transcriptional regulator with XRE-family HTH domain
MATKKKPATLADRIRARRESMGWTQEQVAYKLSLAGRGSVHNWECGRVSPRYPTLVRLAALFGVSVAWLLTGKR